MGKKDVAQMDSVKKILANFKSGTKDGKDEAKQY